MSRARALVVCPGRGSYGRESLGSLAGLQSEALAVLETLRSWLGRPALRELDGLPAYNPRLHVAGEHASLLTAAVTLTDLEGLLADRVETVCVIGNSMGWYVALGVAAGLPLIDTARLIETFGHYQQDNVIGGQLLYPLVDDDWRRDGERQAAVAAALALIPDLHPSIHLGGQAVLAGTDAALAAAQARLPAVQVSGNSFPLRLPLHSAFHTPLMAGAAHKAQAELFDLAWQALRIPLVDGSGRIWRPRHADPRCLADYTLGEQVVRAFDFSLALRVALREYAPDLIILPGPGGNLGGAIAQTLIAEGWAGLSSRQEFLLRQQRDPILISLTRPEQRARVARPLLRSETVGKA